MRRAARIAVLVLGGLALLAALCVGAVIIAGNTAAGRRLLERETANLSRGRVRIAGLAGRFPARIRIARLRLSDSRGVWMSARHISVHWSPLALLGWDLHIERIDVGRIDVTRRPVGARANGRSGHMPVPMIDIDRVRIATVELQPAAAGAVTRLSVHGSLHYRSMRNARASLVAKRTNGMGVYELSLRSIRSAVHASVKLAEPAGGPLEHWLNLPGLGALALEASLQGPPHAERLRLNAHAGKLRASADGTLDLPRRSADLTYRLTSPAMTPRPGLSWRHLALRGRWRGPLAAAQANGTLDLQGLTLTNGARLGALRASLAANGRVLEVRATAEHFGLPGAESRLLEGSPLKLDAKLHLRTADRPLSLILADALFRLRARAMTAGPRSATFDLRVPDVAALARIYHQNITGPLRLSGTLARSGARTHLDIDGTARLHGASTVARVLGTGTHVRLRASLTATQASVRQLSLSGSGISIAATGTAERGVPGSAGGALRSLHAHWRVSVPHLNRLWPSAAGSVQIRGSAQGRLRALAIQMKGRSRLSVHGSPPGALEATFTMRGLPARHAMLRATGLFDGSPLALQASVERSTTHAYRLDIRQAQWKSLRVRGNLTSGSSLEAAHGRVRLSLARVADLQPLLGAALAGRIEGSIALAPVAGRAGARIELTARHLEADGLEGNVTLSGAGPLDSLRVRLAADSPDLHGAPAAVTATAQFDSVARSLDLVGFDAHYRGQRLRLLSPSRLTFAHGLTVHGLRLGAQRAVIALDGQLSPALDVRASVHHLDAGLIDAFAPRLLARGTLNAEATLKGSRAAPNGHVSVRLAGVKLGGPAALGLPAVNAHADAQLHGSTADVSAELDAGRVSRLTLSGRAPLNRTAPLDLRLAGRMDADLMNALLEARGARARGTVTVDARVSGRTQAPRIRGSVELTNGDLRDYAEGVHIADINARLVGERGVLRIESLTGRAGPGRLSATGTIGVLRPQMPIDVSLSARSIQPITNDILTANLDANLRASGTLRHRLDITGTIRIHHASITIPNAFPPNVATLKVIRPGARLRPVRKRAHLVIGLGLALDAPDAIFVRGRGLNAQLGGKLAIAGTTAHPRVSGGFSMTRGTFSLAGTSLHFTHGRVGFNGEGLRNRLDPSLDFLARTSVVYNGLTTVSLHVTGFADNPKISLSSTPELPQDDLLALLLFGKPASRLTPYELAETGAALASLGGIGGSGAGSLNPLTWIRHHLGLSTLSVASAAPAAGGGGARTGGTSITAGKYLTNRVYVAASHTTKGTSQIRVDIALTRHLKLETRLGNGTASTQGTTPENDPGSSIGLSYQLRYGAP